MNTMQTNGNIRYRVVMTTLEKGKTRHSRVENMEGFKTAEECYDKLKRMEIALKNNQEKSLRANGDNESTLDLDFNESQMSVTACANDRLNGLQFMHIMAVESYDVTKPQYRRSEDD